MPPNRFLIDDDEAASVVQRVPQNKFLSADDGGMAAPTLGDEVVPWSDPEIKTTSQEAKVESPWKGVFDNPITGFVGDVGGAAYDIGKSIVRSPYDLPVAAYNLGKKIGVRSMVNEATGNTPALNVFPFTALKAGGELLGEQIVEDPVGTLKEGAKLAGPYGAPVYAGVEAIHEAIDPNQRPPMREVLAGVGGAALPYIGGKLAQGASAVKRAVVGDPIMGTTGEVGQILGAAKAQRGVAAKKDYLDTISSPEFNDKLARSGLITAEAGDGAMVGRYDPSSGTIRYEANPVDGPASYRYKQDTMQRARDTALSTSKEAQALKIGAVEDAGSKGVVVSPDFNALSQAVNDVTELQRSSFTGKLSDIGKRANELTSAFIRDTSPATHKGQRNITVSQAERIKSRIDDLLEHADTYEPGVEGSIPKPAANVLQNLRRSLSETINTAMNEAGYPKDLYKKANEFQSTMLRIEPAIEAGQIELTQPRTPTSSANATASAIMPRKMLYNTPYVGEYMARTAPSRDIPSTWGRAVKSMDQFQAGATLPDQLLANRISAGLMSPAGVAASGAMMGAKKVPEIQPFPRDLRIAMTQAEGLGARIVQEVGKTDPNAAMQIATDVVQKLKDPNVQEDTKRGIVMGLAIQFPSIFTPAPHGLQSVWRGELLSQPDRRKYMSLVQKSPDTPPDVKAKIISAAVQGQFLDIGTPTVEAGVDPAGFTPNMSLDDIPDPTMGLPPSTMQSSPNPEEIPGMTAGPRTMDMLNRMNINNDYLQ